MIFTSGTSPGTHSSWFDSASRAKTLGRKTRIIFVLISNAVSPAWGCYVSLQE
jgi:hypothetical protein